MFKRITFLRVVCDICGAERKKSWITEHKAQGEAEMNGWQTIGEEHLCPNCAKTRLLRLREE